MASIIFRKGKSKPWLAQINRKGHRIFSRSFLQKKDAERWASEQERTIDLTGLPMTIEELKKQTVGDLIDRYLAEITPQKASALNEKTVLEKFKRNPISQKSLAFLSGMDGATYRDQRLKDKWKPKGALGPGKPIKPSTIRREVNTLHHVFEIARSEWGLNNLVNPFHGLRIQGSMHRRKRRLNPGEQDLLETAACKCLGQNKLYVPLVISLAIETGMRLQEIFNLKWEDINTITGQIEIRKSKTDHVSEVAGRTIVMTGRASFLFTAVRPEPDKYNPVENVFPMSKNAFTQAWKDVVKRSGIVGLTFHDLRREAGTRFDEAGLTKGEHDLMMGHANKDMTSLYINADLKRIQKKLDEYALAKMIEAAREARKAA